jgi:hypothetical protein
VRLKNTKARKTLQLDSICGMALETLTLSFRGTFLTYPKKVEAAQELPKFKSPLEREETKIMALEVSVTTKAEEMVLLD